MGHHDSVNYFTPAGEISFAAVLSALRQGWMWIMGAALLCSLAAFGASYLLAPKYRTQVILAPVTQEDAGGQLSSIAAQFGGLASLAGVNLGNMGSTREESIAFLKSRGFSIDFLRDENLLPVLFPDIWDAKNRRWIVDSASDAPTYNKAYTLFDSDIRFVSDDIASGLVTLTIEWRDREQAVEWANKLVARVNRVTRDQAIHEAEKSLEYLNQELAKTSVVGVQQAIYSLIESEINKIMLANVRDEYAFRIIDPPIASDEDDYVAPRRLLLALAGLFVGVLGGAGLALLRAKSPRPAASAG